MGAGAKSFSAEFKKKLSKIKTVIQKKENYFSFKPIDQYLKRIVKKNGFSKQKGGNQIKRERKKKSNVWKFELT